MHTRSRLTALAAVVSAILMLAGACGDSAEDRVQAEAPPPPPAEPAAPEPPPPPAEPAEPAAPEPPPPPPAEAPEPPPEPPPPEPADIGAVQALEAALAVHETATSMEYEMFISMEVSIEGMTLQALDDASLGRVRVVGPLTWTQYDLSGLAAIGEPLSAPPGAESPLLEFIRNSDTGESYIKLEPLLFGAPPDMVGPSAADAIEESGADIGDLWVDASSAETAEQIPGLDGLIEVDLAEFLRLAEAAVDADAVLADERLGSSEVLGIPVESYRLVLDVRKVAGDLPGFMTAFLGEDGAVADDTAAEMAEMMAQLTEPLAVDMTLAVGAGGEVRRLGLDLDLGPLFAGLFAMFGEMGGDGAGNAAPDVEMLLGSRLDVTGFNDPELAVPLPDPAHVITAEALGLTYAPFDEQASLELPPEPVAVSAE